MARIKKVALAALVAFALAAGGLAVGQETTQVASSKGSKASAGRESSIAWAAPEEVQVASSKGSKASAGRESA